MPPLPPHLLTACLRCGYQIRAQDAVLVRVADHPDLFPAEGRRETRFTAQTSGYVCGPELADGCAARARAAAVGLSSVAALLGGPVQCVRCLARLPLEDAVLAPARAAEADDPGSPEGYACPPGQDAACALRRELALRSTEQRARLERLRNRTAELPAKERARFGRLGSLARWAARLLT